MPQKRTRVPRTTETSGQLFDETAREVRSGPPERGFVATNHSNLEYMLAAGMILPCSAFGPKYYRDALESFPGWIPVFLRKLPSEALAFATSEAVHLKPCVAQLRLDALSGPVLALRERFEEIQFPDDCTSRDRAYLIPAPLPTHWIDCLLYGSVADRRECEASAMEVANVPLRSFPRKVDRKLFSPKSDDQWPPEQDVPPIESNLSFAQTSGAISAMLLHLANSGDAGIAACRVAFDPEDTCAALPDTSVLAPMRSWLERGGSETLGDPKTSAQQGQREAQRRIFWESVDRLTAWRSSASNEAAEDVVMNHLREGSCGLQDNLREKFDQLASALQELVGFGEIGPSEVLRRFPSPFSRALTLFLLRKTCRELLEFEDEQLTEEDKLAAAVLFAAREGWERLPLDLRETPGLANAVCHRMADLAHRLGETRIGLGSAPPRCRPLREVFACHPRWRKTEREAALLLARKSGWNCLRTTVRLASGEYQLHIDRSGMLLFLDGEPKAVSVDVEAQSFFEHLAQSFVAPALDAEVRKMTAI